MSENTHEWRYTYLSKVRHWVRRNESGRISMVAVCTVGPAWHMFWHGTHSEEERERMRTLRPCKNCVKRGAPDGELKDDRPIRQGTCRAPVAEG